MPNKSIDVDVVCPFYIAESALGIKCEGIISAEAVHRFESEKEKIEHERFYCCRMYKFCECPYYRALIGQRGEVDPFTERKERHQT